MDKETKEKLYKGHGIFVTKVRILKDNAEIEIDFNQIVQDTIRGKEIDVLSPFKEIQIDLNKLDAIINLNETDKCMIIVSGNQIEVYDTYETVADLWTFFKINKHV